METLNFVGQAALALLGISFVIFWHELGHFLLAKWYGVYVRTFSIGFPPRLVRLFKYKETEYVIGSIPLGGYVHMLGEDEGQSPAQSPGEAGPPADESLRDHPGAFFNKSVWARMAIISAGVVMNVILGFLCFVGVYLHGGRTQTPATIGAVGPGTPAYAAGMESGDEILAINDKVGVTFEDLQNVVIHSGPGERVRFTVRRAGVDEPVVIPVAPRREANRPIRTIGVGWPMTLELSEAAPILPPPGMAGTPGTFKGGDRIVRVGPVGAEPVEVEDAYQLDRLLNGWRDEELGFIVARTPAPPKDAEAPIRTKPDLMIVRVPPVRFVDLGLRMRPGPIVALTPDAPARGAGLEAGDRIVAVDGDAGYDPMRLPTLVRERADAGEPVALTVAKAGGESVEVTIDPIAAGVWSGPLTPDAPLEVAGLGLAMEVRPVVAGVRDGTAAAEAGLKPGDELTGVRFTVPPIDPKGKAKEESVTFDETSWTYVFDFLQRYGVEDLEWTVAGREQPLKLAAAPVAGWWFPDRGLNLQGARIELPPLALAAAVERASTETLGVIGSFYKMLRRLWDGGVGVQALSGPINIARVAFTIAGASFVEFLWFIGFISVNLAVVNFLPLPPLDGGKMVFLIGEAVRGRPLPESWQALPTYIGVALLLSLMSFLLFREGVMPFFQ